MSDDNQPFSLPSANQVGNIVELAISGWALSMEVWLRHGFGSRYIGIQGITVIPIIIGFSMLFEGHDIRPLYYFLLGYLGMVGFRRAQMVIRVRKGERNHSRYSGTPGLMPRWSEITVKKYVEPIFTFFTGIVICQFNAPLGAYVFIGGFMLMLAISSAERWTRQRVREMNDAVSEQEVIAERFRDLRGDSF